MFRRLLDIARQVAVQRDPNAERARQLSQLVGAGVTWTCPGSGYALRECHLHPEVLLRLDKHRLGEAERSRRIGFAVVARRSENQGSRLRRMGNQKVGISIIDLFAHDQRGHRVVDQVGQNLGFVEFGFELLLSGL